MSVRRLSQKQVSVFVGNRKGHPGRSGRNRGMGRREGDGHRSVARGIVDDESLVEFPLNAAVLILDAFGSGAAEALIPEVVPIMQVIGSRKGIRIGEQAVSVRERQGKGRGGTHQVQVGT